MSSHDDVERLLRKIEEVLVSTGFSDDASDWYTDLIPEDLDQSTADDVRLRSWAYVSPGNDDVVSALGEALESDTAKFSNAGLKNSLLEAQSLLFTLRRKYRGWGLGASPEDRAKAKRLLNRLRPHVNLLSSQSIRALRAIARYVNVAPPQRETSPTQEEAQPR